MPKPMRKYDKDAILKGRIAALTDERDRFRRIAVELHDIVIWMSGSSDFGPSGKAATGWEKYQPTISRAARMLSRAGDR